MKNKKKGGKLRILSRLLKGSWKYFAICIGAGVLFTVCELLIPQILRISVDSVIGSEPLSLPGFLTAWLDKLGGVEAIRQNMWSIAVVMAFFGGLSAVFRYTMHLTNAKAGETLVKTSRDLLYDHIQHLPWSWHSKNPTGDIIQRCTSDVEHIKTFFQEQFVSVFRIIVLIILSLVCMISMNWKLSLVAVFMVPVVVTYSVLFHNQVRDRFTACDENEGILSTIAQENLTGVRVVRAFGRENFERERFERQNQVYTNLWIKMCQTLANFWAVSDCTSCLQVMLVVIFGTVLCVNGQMTAGEFISFAFYNTMLINPVRRLGRVISEMSKTGVSVARIAQVLDAPIEEDLPDAQEEPMTGDIVFDHVSFSYGEDSPEVLREVSFTIPSGKSFGILGGTGSGKSTLLLLLCRLYEPTGGKITVGGKDIAHMPARYVRDHVGIVLQEPFLLSRTIGENIGICGADQETIEKAAATACIHQDIMRFSQGYETMVGERGVTLSGGQKQRVAIARMLTKKTPVLVFDDSLSAVDTQTDEKIRAALAENLDATTLIISHRVTTLMDCDNILVLEGGKVAEYGTPDQLLEKNGRFRHIYDLQMSIGEEEDQ